MKLAFRKLGFDVPYSEIKNAMEKYDSDKGGSISFDEFREIFVNKLTQKLDD
jgi:Ca2+-binding EF-hand superfamily protein